MVPLFTLLPAHEGFTSFVGFHCLIKKIIIILNLHDSSWLIYLVQNPERRQETVVPLQGH